MWSEIEFDQPSQLRGGLMVYLEDDAERGVQLFMAEQAVNRDEALRRIVLDWLIGHGYLPEEEDDDLTGKRDPDGCTDAALGRA